MKKFVFCCIVVSILLSCTACGTADIPEATAMPTAAPTQPHSCTEVCEFCGLCVNESCEDAVCAEKCTGVHWEEPHVFPGGDYITTEPVSVDTGTLVFDIGENVYVPEKLAEMGEIIGAEIEKAAGLDFDGAGYARKNYPDGKVHVNASRDMLYAGNPMYPWYQGLTTSEVGVAFADPWNHVMMSPGDLFVSGGCTVVHELAHVLMFRQSEWQHCQLLDEGFAEYTSYLVMQELEKNHPTIAYHLGESTQVVYNMVISDYEKLYEHPLEYWFENTFEYSGNANYSIGFRFMTYLHEVYGDYSKWITEIEKAYSYNMKSGLSNQSSVKQMVEVLKATYGEDVLDNFYPWLKEHLDRFSANVHYSHRKDLTIADGINWYPKFNAVEASAKLARLKYDDLYVNLESIRKYLSEYKGIDVTNLSIQNVEKHTIICYQADGTFTTPTQELHIPLDGVSYIKLVGQGVIGNLQIIGFEAE